MLLRSIAVILICASCGPGLIPCPDFSVVRYKKQRIHRSFLSASAKEKRDADKENQRNKETKKTVDRIIENVSIEEWDCPRPGGVKYLPKAIKENIKKNLKKVYSNSEK